MCQVYKEWLKQKQEWIEVLNDLKKNELGFSFTMLLPDNIRKQIGLTFKPPIPKPHREVTSGDSSPYLKLSQEIEIHELETDYQEYVKIYEKTLKPGIEEYLRIGQVFHDEITDPSIEIIKKRNLLIFSEGNDHLFHNAAVLWLECNKPDFNLPSSKSNVSSQPISDKKTSVPNTIAAQDRLIYEEVLKHLWLGEIIRSHPGWDITSVNYPNRMKAIVNFTIGHECHKELGPLAEKHHKDFLAKRLKSHVTLGKVILRRKTQFHDEEMIRVHPGFWGLFAISPIHNQDRGFHDNDPDTQAWVNCLTNAPYSLQSEKFRHNPAGFQIYERVPRLFEDSVATLPGVYLHRSKAHGRDDFLAIVKGNGDNRKVMIACTKGVGADPDLIPKTTAGNYTHSNEFQSSFSDTERKLFPFAFPASKEIAIKAGSWANMGFCVAMGDGHIEVATVDYQNFGEMYDAVKKAPLIEGLLNGFVEPFVCIEISCVDYNLERFEPNVLTGIKQGLIGFPVEVVTLAPSETSLRLYKRNDAQDYDYDCPELEIAEWSRCYRKLTFDGELQIINDIDADFDKLITGLKLLRQPYLGNNLPIFANLDALTNQSFPETKKRMTLAFKIMHAMIASYVAFLNHDWATDDYTGSFSGRNFGSGPRDSNVWGLFANPSAASDGKAHAGEGPLCGHIDLANLGVESVVQTSGLYKSLGLARVKGDDERNIIYLVFDWETTDPALIENVINQREFLMWQGCKCLIYSQKLTQFLGSVGRRFDAYCTNEKGLKNPARMLKTMFDDSNKRETFNKEICKKYREIMRAEANILPDSLKAIILKLRQD